MSAAKRKINPLTIQEKKALILEVENSKGRTKSQIAEEFRIPKSTLSTILKEKERILELTEAEDVGPQRKRMRTRRGLYPQLEEALFSWLQEQAAANQVVSGPKMLARSQELARQLGVDDFKTSSSWLDSFKKRHGLAAGRPDTAEYWRPEATPEGTVPLAQLTAMLDNFAATEVFVVAEMGLTFDLTPADAAVGACADGELASRRFSVLVAASADGSQKLPLLIVGDRPISGASQPGRIAYHADPAAWIQPQHFSSWLNQRNGELCAQGRKALFLCELLPVHAAAGGGRDSLQLACMPPSPLTQDQLSSDGVLHALKRQYRRRVAGFLREHGRPPTATEAVQLVSRAWWQDVSCDDVRRYHAAVSLLRDEANGLPPPRVEENSELSALAGTRYAPPEGLTLASYAALDDAVMWMTPPAGTAAGVRPPVVKTPRPAQDRGPSPPQPAASPAPVKRERGGGERVASPAASRRRPSSQEALKAVLVLQQFFQLREPDEELDEVISFVAFAKEKIVKLQMQETRDNGVLKTKKEVKTEKPDTFGNVKFESPILSIDPDVDPEESKESSEVKPVPPVRPVSDLLAPRKGGIRVGAQFQAEVPTAPVAEPPCSDSLHGSGTRWTTEHKLTEDQINQFVLLTRAVGMFARACDAGSAATQQGIHVAAANASRDVTRAHALDVLHRHDYQLAAALTSLVPAGGPVLCRDELEDWSVHETAIFEEAITRHGKMFDLVRREYLPWKTSAQITEYYYMWKTTDRYVRRRRAKHIARRQAAAAAQMAAPSPRDTVSPSGGATVAPTGGSVGAPSPASVSPPAPSPLAAVSLSTNRPTQANDALTLLSPMLNALGTSVSIEPVAAGPRRSPEQRGKPGATDKVCGGVRLSGECSITPVPVTR